VKKSEIYERVQYIVIGDDSWLSDAEKIEVLRELFQQEDLARFSEEQAAKEARD
jgi:hypothetical protein